MNEFRKKRENLELFAEEQIIGPGAYNKRFFFLEDWGRQEFSEKNLNEEKALHNTSEVIPEVPAYQYSSAILFPGVKIKAENQDAPNIINEEVESTSTLDDSNSENTSADDDKLKESTADSSENLTSKQQNYPDSMGLSFVVGKDINLQKDLKVQISFRRYSIVSKANCYKRKIAYWISEYTNEIKTAIETYFSGKFAFEEKDGNSFVSVVPNSIANNAFYEIDYICLNLFLTENLIKSIIDTLKPVESEKDNKKNYSVDEICLYTISNKTYREEDYQNVVTLYEDNIIRYLKNKMIDDCSNYENLKEIITQLEIYNQLKGIVTDLKSIFKEKNATPIWESNLYNQSLVLPERNSQNNPDRHKEISINPGEKDLKDLEYSVQYIERNNQLYVKIVLTNKNFITLKENEPPQLNKKNDANKKAFFGVKLIVEEDKENLLQPYNPPLLLDIDEEDNFNKLVYSQFKDYGEGYNTSSSWGKISENQNLRYVCTDFLPKQETPKVDFKPSKITKEEQTNETRIRSRLSNENILSIRYLSSLSNASDEDVLDGLKTFVSDYNQWINDKKKELLDDNDTMTKQLKSCDKDCKRLYRNIELLRNNPEAIAAFRIANTAMFMQLHHSIEVKKSKKHGIYFLQENNNEQYYKDINLEQDYKWRSFQLAFVLLNIDAFVQPTAEDNTVEDIFGTGWPERNELADLVWFPTGGGKTEAYLGIIAFAIAFRRFTKGDRAGGTTVLMRYTLRLLTLQQFQRATLLICALESIRKDQFAIPHENSLGEERITIGLFVGESSLPNKWSSNGNNDEKSMLSELQSISAAIRDSRNISTKLPFTECPWCGEKLFTNQNLNNVSPNHDNNEYGINTQLNICCNNQNCTFKGGGNRNRPSNLQSLPLRLFDEDIYKFPPTLLFGTVDKFAAFPNKVSRDANTRNQDSRRLLGKGSQPRNQERNCLPPELIIQDELHLLLGPLGSAVGLFEKGIDYLCTYKNGNQIIRPKIITSTATTRNTDKQIFALFNRRSEIFPKQGISCDDSFFAYYERDEQNPEEYISNRKYVGVLPVGKTQVWMQLRVASIALAHRLKYLKEQFSLDEMFTTPSCIDKMGDVLDYYHTVLSYFNSLKDVGKTQSQLSHYLPGDLDYVVKNTISWSFMDKIFRLNEISYSELTGRLSGEEVKMNLSEIEKKWSLFSKDNNTTTLNRNNPPEFIISTNMISVGIDVSRFNTMIISSMPRSIAEYIQASSRVARDKEGIVFTIFHPFRSRDISHFQKFKEFHEKFYSYVEPISVTPFASKALDRYLAMFIATIVRHNETLELMNNDSARDVNNNKIIKIKAILMDEVERISENAKKIDDYLQKRENGIHTSIDGIISEEELSDISNKTDKLLEVWLERLEGCNPPPNLEYRNENHNQSLFAVNSDVNRERHWKVDYSLREIAPSTVIKTVQQ